MWRITFFEAPDDEARFEGAWHDLRDGGALLLRSHSPSADFRYVELAARGSAALRLPARSHSASYQTVSDDLPEGAPFDLVLVNPFEVPAADDEGFVAAWMTVRNLVKGRAGYLGSRLNRAIADDAEFRFVNVSPWGSIDAFTAAVADPAFAREARLIYHRAHPSLYVPVP